MRLFLFLFAFMAVATYWAPADAQMRARKSIQRSIQKNVEIAVKRKLLRLNIRESAGAVEFLEISPDHRFVLTLSEDRKFRLWDFALGRQIKTFSKTAPKDLADITLSKDGKKFLAVNQKNQTSIWSHGKEEKITPFNLPEKHKAATYSFSPNGALVVAGTLSGHVLIFDATHLKLLSSAKVSDKPIQSIHIQQENLLMVATTKNGEVSVLETNSGALVWSSKQQGLSDKFTSAHFGGDPNILVAGTNSGKVVSIDISRGKTSQTISINSAVKTVNVSQNGQWNLAYGSGAEAFVWKTGAEDKVIKIKAHDEGLNSARFVGDAPFLLTAGKDKISKLWTMESGMPVLSLVSTKNGWAVVDDKGRYDGSDTALKNIDWAAETDLLAIDNFVEEFYEPGLMSKKRFGQEMISENPPSLAEGILPTPEIKIDVPERVNINNSNEFEVTLNVEGKGGGVKDVRLYHNFKRVPESAVVNSKKGKNDQGFEMLTVTYKVKPSFGNNDLSAQARSSENIYGVTTTASYQGEGQTRKPRLHVIAIGVNNYYEEELNLNFALADAEGISGLLGQVGEGIFDEVVFHPVFDEAATSKGIVAALAKVKEQTTTADVVAIYMSGHGESVGDDFYYVPYDFKNPFTPERLVQQGLSGKKVRDIILDMNAQRILWMLDTCKSGAALRDFADARDSRSLRKLGVQLGVHVISATAKNQFAVEFDEIGHGVFTYTLLLALQGSADLMNVDKRVSVKEAADFLSTMVPELSSEYADHQQFPMIYSSGFDFVLSKVE